MSPSLIKMFASKAAKNSEKTLAIPLSSLEEATRTIPGPSTGDRHEDCARKWLNAADMYRNSQTSDERLLQKDFSETPEVLAGIASDIRRSKGETIAVPESRMTYIYNRVAMLSFRDADMQAFARNLKETINVHPSATMAGPAHTRGRSLTPLVSSSGQPDLAL